MLLQVQALLVSPPDETEEHRDDHQKPAVAHAEGTRTPTSWVRGPLPPGMWVRRAPEVVAARRRVEAEVEKGLALGFAEHRF